jgi:hypothetical protein
MKSACIRKSFSMALFASFLILSIYNCGSAPPRPDMVVAPTPFMNNEGSFR